MQNSQPFDYERPSRDTLAGVYVEASDEVISEVGSVDVRQPVPAGQVLPRREDLFGVTVAVDDTMPNQPDDTSND
jgi:hypothetical protein